MQDALKNPEAPESTQRLSWLTISGSAILLAALLAGLWWFLLKGAGEKASSPQTAASMTPAERAYVKNLRVENIALSRAENFLHQEVTTLTGELVNTGSQPVLTLALTFEFADSYNQIVLRETRSVLSASMPKLAPAERRAFEISFEHIPSSWNMQAPELRLAYLRLEPPK